MYDLHGQGIPLPMPINQELVLNSLTINHKSIKSLYERLVENELRTLKERAAYYGLDRTNDFDEFKKNIEIIAK